jgi:hypothetical protein
MPPTCLNCNTGIPDEAVFCQTCGQKVNIHRLTLGDVLHDGFHYFTHADKGFLQLLKALVTKTGAVAREYVTGKRKSYFSPINFYLIVAGIYLLVMTTLNADKTNTTSVSPRPANVDSVSAKQDPENVYNHRRYKVSRFFNKNSNIVAIIAVPLIAIFFRLCYLKAPFNYTEHLVAGFYMTGLTNLVYVLLIVPLAMLAGLHSYYRLFILLVFQVTYDAIFYYRFIGNRNTVARVKAAGVSLGAALFWFALNYLLIYLYVSTGFWGLV